MHGQYADQSTTHWAKIIAGLFIFGVKNALFMVARVYCVHGLLGGIEVLL